MRWKAQKNIKIGTVRIFHHFALFPITCPMSGTTYWLEWVNVSQQMDCPLKWDSIGFKNDNSKKYWKVVKIN